MPRRVEAVIKAEGGTKYTNTLYMCEWFSCSRVKFGILSLVANHFLEPESYWLLNSSCLA